MDRNYLTVCGLYFGFLFVFAFGMVGCKGSPNLCGVTSVNIEEQQHVLIGCRDGRGNVKIYALDNLTPLAQIRGEGRGFDISNETAEKLVRERLSKQWLPTKSKTGN